MPLIYATSARRCLAYVCYMISRRLASVLFLETAHMRVLCCWYAQLMRRATHGDAPFRAFYAIILRADAAFYPRYFRAFIDAMSPPTAELCFSCHMPRARWCAYCRADALSLHALFADFAIAAFMRCALLMLIEDALDALYGDHATLRHALSMMPYPPCWCAICRRYFMPPIRCRFELCRSSRYSLLFGYTIYAFADADATVSSIFPDAHVAVIYSPMMILFSVCYLPYVSLRVYSADYSLICCLRRFFFFFTFFFSMTLFIFFIFRYDWCRLVAAITLMPLRFRPYCLLFFAAYYFALCQRFFFAMIWYSILPAAIIFHARHASMFYAMPLRYADW